MAGLVLKELKQRGLVERTLIVVPRHLKDQWLREMKERFHEHFVPVDRGVTQAFWGRKVWQEHKQVITSIDYAKQNEVLASLRESTWDLIIVDEAHKMAAYRYGDEVKKTERYRLGEVLSQNVYRRKQAFGAGRTAPSPAAKAACLCRIMTRPLGHLGGDRGSGAGCGLPGRVAPVPVRCPSRVMYRWVPPGRSCLIWLGSRGAAESGAGASASVLEDIGGRGLWRL
ncbi:MAG: DEAD/DEAH box helicase family protein, partial [Bacillota bacterium]